jgi:YVTN family beta-propeller protein
MPTLKSVRSLRRAAVVITFLFAVLPGIGHSAVSYQIFVSNERSGTVTVIDGSDFHIIATIPVGKRPRGIHASPDGRRVYVALSGTPIEAPPQLDSHGNPIFKRGGDDDDEGQNADKSADGIGVVDVARRKLIEKISVGSDPEEFDLSRDGKQLYVSNEDVMTASVVNIAKRQVEHIALVGQEPEGVTTTPDGRSFYVTCETAGDIYVISATTYQPIAHFKVDPRPRSVAFLPGTHIGFIPSESAGELNVIDYVRARLLKVITLPPGSRPMKVKVSRDGRWVYTSDGRAGTISVLDAHTYRLVHTIKVGKRPWGLALSPDGRYLFSANGPSNDVSVVDLRAKKEIARIKVGASPWGITVVRQAP